MLVRWSDQENFLDWTPTATNQSGDLRLSSGTEDRNCPDKQGKKSWFGQMLLFTLCSI
jgi:hypothetical protein